MSFSGLRVMRLSTTSRGAHQERHLGLRLPLHFEEGAQIAGGIGALLFGAVFAGFPVLFFVLSRLNGESIPLQAVLVLAEICWSA
jgi:hypothetical protein